MHDREIELIDYLRVMWWGKWIILGSVIIAIGLSVLFSGLQSPTCSGSTEILLREYVTAALSGDCNPRGIMADAVDSALTAMEPSMPSIAITLKGNRITLLHSSASPIAEVREALVQAAEALEQQLLLALTEEIKSLKYETQLQETVLTAQLGILRQRLGEELASDEVALSVALAEQIAGLEVQLAQTQVQLDTLKTADPGDLFTLDQIGQPVITTAESNLKSTIAIAGFLGLIISILLTFFAHYLLQVRERESISAKDNRS